jgi:hypothetical protein
MFGTLDTQNGYHVIQIKEGDEFKTAFRTPYGQLKYQVTPFGLANPLVRIQAYINNCRWRYIDNFIVYYLHDIFFYTANSKEHEDQSEKCYNAYRNLHSIEKANMFQFSVQEVGCLGSDLNSEGIGMGSDRISTIEDWPTQEYVRDVQVIDGFTNWYPRFIRIYATVKAPRSNRLKTQCSRKWELTLDGELAF